ncbi:MAG: type II toxin-antitoxin system HicA family toxin [Cyclobacteriaceae bacterium]
MSKKEKLLVRLLSKPKDFTYSELVSLLNYYGYSEFTKGKTAGSRRAFVNEETKHVIRLHKPHPRNILKEYQIKDVIEELKQRELI